MNHTVTIRWIHLDRLMNFSQWIEVDGQTICNQIDISEARRLAKILADAIGCNVHEVDHWEAPIAAK